MSLAPALLVYAERLGIGILQHKYLYAAVALLGWYVVYQRYLHPLSRFPGPCKAPSRLCLYEVLLINAVFASLSIFWKIASVLSRRQSLNEYEMHKKYGPIFRDGPNSVTVSEARALEPIYGTKNDLDKGAWYLIMEPDNSGEDYTAFSSTRAEQHRRLRKRIARTVRTGPLYPLSSLEALYAPCLGCQLINDMCWVLVLNDNRPELRADH